MLAFFTLSPAMHERYLFMAVPLAAFWAAFEPRQQPWFWGLSALCFFNMNLVRPLSGDFVWGLVACGSVLGLVLMGLQRHGVSVRPVLQPIAAAFERVPGSGWWSALLVWLLVTWDQGQARIMPPAAEIEGVYLSDLEPLHASQGWGRLKFDSSAENRPLRIGDRIYRKGLGTHARSEIEFAIPAGMHRLRCTAGLDARSGRHGRVRFIVRIDGRPAWRGRIHANATEPETVDVHWGSGRRLTLVVEPLGSPDFDHANWVDCYFAPG